MQLKLFPWAPKVMNTRKNPTMVAKLISDTEININLDENHLSKDYGYMSLSIFFLFLHKFTPFYFSLSKILFYFSFSLS